MKPVLISKLYHMQMIQIWEVLYVCWATQHQPKTWKWRKYQNINNELNSITEWLNINKLSLNIKKTKLMLFHYHKHNVNSLTTKLAINSEPIERVTGCNLALQSMNTSVGLDSSKSFQTKYLKPSELCVDWKGFCRLIYWSLCTHLLFCRLEK